MRKKLKSNKIFFYPVSSPHITKRDISSVNQAMKSGRISSDGPEIKIFKNKKFPNLSYLARYGLYLPSYFQLKKMILITFQKSLIKFLNKNG
jgi:hypothetical protein